MLVHTKFEGLNRVREICKLSCFAVRFMWCSETNFLQLLFDFLCFSQRTDQ